MLRPVCHQKENPVAIGYEDVCPDRSAKLRVGGFN
jgi:hypothetical protein